jgi:WD40 repeat protein
MFTHNVLFGLFVYYPIGVDLFLVVLITVCVLSCSSFLVSFVLRFVYFVHCSGLKFWEFELRQMDDGPKRLTLTHVKTLQLSDDVLCNEKKHFFCLNSSHYLFRSFIYLNLGARCSPNSRLIGVSLLDNTVKLFYFDTLNFFVSLYGHRLPVLSFDFSSDSSLIVTGSADKNIKVFIYFEKKKKNEEKQERKPNKRK